MVELNFKKHIIGVKTNQKNTIFKFEIEKS